MKPKLSVIIPVYNVEKYIRQCLDSVYQQTFRDFEVILVDDGSPDNCGVICDEYAEKYGDEIPTKVIHKENGGLCCARNDGMAMACGEWITFVDSDDWIETNYYESLFGALGNQKVDIFIAGKCYINESNGIQKTDYCIDKPQVYKTREELDYMMTRIFVAERHKTPSGIVKISTIQAPWDKIYRAEFIRKNNLHYSTMLSANEDILFNFIAFGLADSIGTSTVGEYHYRQVESSISHCISEKKINSKVAFLETAISFLNHNNANPAIRSALNLYAINCAVTIVQYFSQDKLRINEFDNYIRKPCFAEAIREKENPYASFKMKLITYFLRMPGSVILRLYSIYRKFKRR